MVCSAPLRAQAPAPTEDQVKAVFLFNFAHFVQWPGSAFRSAAQPFVIGLAGGDALLPLLREAVAGEQVQGHPLAVRELGDADAAGSCHILFIGRAMAHRLGELLQRMTRPGTLTVSDVPGSARRGTMIELANENNRIRLHINREAAQAAGLTISSNLLRPAEIVRTERG